MPRRHHRKMKGGFLEGITNSLSSFTSSLSQESSQLWQKTKQAASSLTGSTPSYSTTPSYNYGGSRRKTKRMRGGFKDNTPVTGLASHAAPFSGETAKPHNWVGGRTKRRGRRSNRRGSRRH